jgi:hypothetical protein
MKILLKISEEWSYKNGMEFAPQKCFALGEMPGLCRLKMYNLALPVISDNETTTYLGIPFGIKGINFDKLASERTNKARQITAIMASCGFNGAGWPVSSSAKVYKAFLRSVLEYGIGLKT